MVTATAPRPVRFSKTAVSRVIATLKSGLETWRKRSLADLDVIYLYLDGFALRVRSAGKAVGVPVLGIVGVLADGRKHLLALELCTAESFGAWKGCLDDLVARDLRSPVLCIIDDRRRSKLAVAVATRLRALSGGQLAAAQRLLAMITQATRASAPRS